MKQRHNGLLTLALSLLLGTSVCCGTSQAMENPSSIDLANITSTSLSLKGRKIGDAGAHVLAKNTTLTSLNLEDNLIGDAGVQALATNTTLISLNLRQNQIGDAGAHVLAKNTTLTSLNLENNNIRDTGARALLTTLRAHTNLTELSLNWPNGINMNEVKRLLACNTGLARYSKGEHFRPVPHVVQVTPTQNINLASITSTFLSLKGKKIGDAGAQVLAKNTTLTSLNLEDNLIGDAGAQVLAKNTTLTSLDLERNGIRDAGAHALAKNTTLTSLDLRENQIGCEGAQALLNALRTQTNLTELSLKWPNSNNEREVEFLLNRNRELASNRTHQVIPTVPAPTPQPMQGTFPQNVIAPVLPDEPSETKEDKKEEVRVFCLTY
ncbi:hypothetical protein [Candidatus Odyssella acanthamoebae]|uniref:hypothetical protein n=1 Tax=Candidatus Odyssella acanthamoebae TaxID=91604 RepID=UPI000690763A|nr:hypothetical protein [Candidatus Paracaedibacter acanthamoebae]